MFTSQHDSKFRAFFRSISPLSWSLKQAYLYLKEFWVSYGTGNILPTLFPKAFGPSKSTFLLVFHALTVWDTASFSAGHRIAIERKHCYYLKKWRKIRVTVLVFAVGLQIVRITCVSCNWGEFQSGMYVEGGRRHWKIRFYGIYIEVKQLGHNVIKVKLKCHESSSEQHPLSTSSVRK